MLYLFCAQAQKHHLSRGGRPSNGLKREAGSTFTAPPRSCIKGLHRTGQPASLCGAAWGYKAEGGSTSGPCSLGVLSICCGCHFDDGLNAVMMNLLACNQARAGWVRLNTLFVSFFYTLRQSVGRSWCLLCLLAAQVYVLSLS